MITTRAEAKASARVFKRLRRPSIIQMLQRDEIINLFEKILRLEEVDAEVPDWRLSRELRLTLNGNIEIVERNTHGNRRGDLCHWKVSTFELDPLLIEVADYDEDRPYLTIPTKFFRELVTLRSLTVNGYAREHFRSEFYVPLRHAPSDDELKRLAAAIGSVQGEKNALPKAVDLRALQDQAKGLKEIAEALANNVDFTPHEGRGVTKQGLSIDLRTMTLELRQISKHSVDDKGREVVSRIPLYALNHRNYLLITGPNPNPGAMGRGIPPVHINALIERVPIKQHIEAGDGHEAFDLDTSRAEIYVSTLADTVTFQKALCDLIPLARDIGRIST